MNFRFRSGSSDDAFNLYPLLELGKFKIYRFNPGFNFELSFGKIPYPFLVIGLFGKFIMFRFTNK